MSAASSAISITLPVDSPLLCQLNEDDESTVLSPKWSSYDNLAKFVSGTCAKSKGAEAAIANNSEGRRPPLLSEVLTQLTATATVKVDGSNLGVVVRYEPLLGPRESVESWRIVLLQGRSAPLFCAEGFELQPAAEEEGDDEAEDATAAEKPTTESLKKIVVAEKNKYLKMAGYGNAGSLGALPVKIRDFAAIVANTLDAAKGIDTIEIFGEAMRHKAINVADKTESSAALASYHPFGCKLFDVDTTKSAKLLRLTPALHKCFLAAAVTLDPPLAEVPNLAGDFDAMVSTCIAAKDAPKVFPPPIFTAGEPLIDALEKLTPMLLSMNQDSFDAGKSSPFFEGVFVILQPAGFDALASVGGVKFKTCSHDEQSGIPSLEQLGLDDEKKVAESKILTRFVAVWQMMEKIKRQPKIAVGKVKKAAAPVDANAQNAKAQAKALDAQILFDVDNACKAEFGKMSNFDHVPKGERGKIAADLEPLVLKEVQRYYEQDGKPIPYTVEALKKKLAGGVRAAVSKVPFTEGAAAAAAE